MGEAVSAPALSVLVVDENADSPKELEKALAPDVEFEDVERSASLLDAVQTFAEANFSLCLINSVFPRDALQVFFNDINKIPKAAECIFVQVRPQIEPGCDRNQLKSLGFASIISRAGTAHDKDALKEALKGLLHQKEIVRRKVDVESKLDMLFKEVDRAAKNRKRGKNIDFTKIFSRFVEQNTEFDAAVLEDYFKNLSEAAQRATPEKNLDVKIPDKVLSKQLPHLTEEGYQGTSLRVWEKVRGKHGKSRSSEKPATPEDSKKDEKPE